MNKFIVYALMKVNLVGEKMKERKISILGAGLACIDMIKVEADEYYMVGGTAANVMTFLSLMGMKVDFLMAKYKGISADWLDRAMKARGINLMYFATSSDNAPQIIETLNTENGSHSFTTVCPMCNKKICKLSLPTKAQLLKNTDSMEKYYDLFYYDRISEGIRQKALSNTSGWNFYEPNSFRIYSSFLDCVKTADILKLSNERITPRYEKSLIKDLQDTKIKLIIISMGKAGLKISLRNSEGFLEDWVYLESCKSPVLIDSSGAGDWVSAVFLYYFLQIYPNNECSIDKTQVINILINAQKVASIVCGCIGAQGILADEKLLTEINSILKTSIDVVCDENYVGGLSCSYCKCEM